jgi:hypothetical protein
MVAEKAKVAIEKIQVIVLVLVHVKLLIYLLD